MEKFLEKHVLFKEQLICLSRKEAYPQEFHKKFEHRLLQEGFKKIQQDYLNDFFKGNFP